VRPETKRNEADLFLCSSVVSGGLLVDESSQSKEEEVFSEVAAPFYNKARKDTSKRLNPISRHSSFYFPIKECLAINQPLEK